jgi:signal peptidase I
MSATAGGPSGAAHHTTSSGNPGGGQVPPVAGRLLPRRRLGGVLQGLAIALGLALMVGGFTLIAVDYRPYRVPTDSMEPTVHPGDTVLARRVHGTEVGRGDVVVFKDSSWADALLVKRVVAVGGDRLVCCDSARRLSVNGRTVDEPYLDDHYNSGAFTVTVPQGRLFLMGDNRVVSLDSRVHLDQASGTVPASDVRGRVEGIAWPLGRLGVTGRTPAFDAVGTPGAAAPGPLGPAAGASAAGAALILLTAALGPLAALVRRLRRTGG